MRKLFVLIVCLVLSISVVRTLFNAEPLRVSAFLELLSRTDINFTHTVENIVNIVEYVGLPNFYVSEFGILGTILSAIWEIIVWLNKVLIAPIGVLIGIFKDLVDFVSTCFRFFTALLGI